MEREQVGEDTDVPVSEPIIKQELILPPVVMNGFIPPPMYMDAKLNDSFPNNLPIPNDISKIPNGLLNTSGLLPAPLMMPLIPPLPLPGGGMIPGPPLRGMLPPAGFPGLLRPPIPYAPPNQLLSPISNEMSPPPMLPLVNGNVDEQDMLGIREMKSEGEDTE